MNLYVLMHKSFAPRYRIPQFVPFFRRKGIETDLVHFPRGVFNRWSKLVRARKYDFVVLERKLIQPWELSFLRKCSRRLIFDFDDAIMYRSSKRATPRSGTRMTKFKRIVESCDLVLAGNNFLKEQALRFTSKDRVVVIPTVVDLTTYPVKTMAPRPRRSFWAGLEVQGLSTTWIEFCQLWKRLQVDSLMFVLKSFAINFWIAP